MSALVSVAVPTYNRSNFIGQTIESVLSQSYTNFELIVLDDGSTDATHEIVCAYAQRDPRIKHIRHECNLGFVANWTYGVKLARGDYIAVLGDDDIYRPEFLARRVQALELHRDAFAAAGPFDCDDARRAHVRQSRLPCVTDSLLAGEDLIDLCLGTSGEWWVGATLYRSAALRSIWNKVIFAGTALDFAAHIHLCLLPDAKLAFVQRSEVQMRVHAGQESVSNNLALAESAALMALQLWYFKLLPENRYLDKFGERFSVDLDHYARVLWDRGRVRESRSVFAQELRINPYRIITWLRYFRTFLMSPREIKA